MDFEKFEIPKIETVKGSEEGSVYLIIAKSKNLKMGIRVFMIPYKIKNSVWVTMAFRLRVEANGESATDYKAKESFGNFPFYMSGDHASVVGVIPLAALPCSPSEVYTIYTSFNGSLETNLLTQIKENFGNTGAKFCIDEESILVTLREQIKDIIPEVVPTVNSDPKVLWVKQPSGKQE